MPREHPDPDFLDRFAAGRLGRREKVQVGWHLFHCPSCREQVETTEQGRAVTADLLARLGNEAPVENPVAESHTYESAIAKSLEMLAERQESLEREREQAPFLYADLVRHPPARQQVLVRNTRRYQSWGLAQHLIERCSQAWSTDPRHAEDLATLALAIAEQFEPPLYQAPILNDLLGRCWVHIGNCRRLATDLQGAEEAFDRAGELLAAGTEDPVEWALYLQRRATLHLYQRRLDEVEPLLRRAIASFRRVGDPHLAGRAMVVLANLHRERCDPERAISTLQGAMKLLDLEREPRLALGTAHNLIQYLADAGRFMEARALFGKSRELYELYADPLLRQKRVWVQGIIAGGLGQEQQAEACLERARSGFVAQGLSAQAAAVSLDLAEVYARQGRSAEIRQVAEEVLPIFQALDIEREALAAVLLFREAAAAEQVTVALMREVTHRMRASDVGARADSPR